MYNPWAKAASTVAKDATFSQKAAAISHQMLVDASANTLAATGLTTAGIGAGIGAINGAVSYDGTFLGGAVNGAMLGGIGGVGLKSFASVYSSGLARAGTAEKSFSWKTVGNGW